MHAAGVVATCLALCAAALTVALLTYAPCDLSRAPRSTDCGDYVLYEGQCLYFSYVGWTYYGVWSECKKRKMVLYGPDNGPKMRLMEMLRKQHWLDDRADEKVRTLGKYCHTLPALPWLFSRTISATMCTNWSHLSKALYVCSLH